MTDKDKGHYHPWPDKEDVKDIKEDVSGIRKFLTNMAYWVGFMAAVVVIKGSVYLLSSMR